MNTFTANWEDEENNRIVQLAVDYQIDDGQIAIDTVTPTSIIFFDSASRTPVRRIGVWTEKGRAVLRRQFQAETPARHLQNLIEQELPITVS
ncbi:MAG TPA: hypothetical protein EYQ75_23240 [Planctomycetaceae bacterium]|jgi:hypothetical protein|nr:hypothetical protein [Planctomycetaceae bacterium]